MESTAIIGSSQQAAALLAGHVEGRAFPGNRLTCAADRFTPAFRRAAERAGHVCCSLTDPRLASASTYILTGDPALVVGFPASTAQWTEGSRVLSAVPGFSIRRLKNRFPEARAIIRVAFSDSVRSARGVSVYAVSAGTEQTDADGIHDLLGALGHRFRVLEDELDTAAKVLGAAPPLLYELAAALVDAGIEDGLDPLLAHELAVHSLFGAGAILESSGSAPEILLNATRRSGAAGAIECLENRGFRQIIRRSLDAAGPGPSVGKAAKTG